MPQYNRACVVQHHTADVQHPTDDIDCMFRAIEAFCKLYGATVAILYFDIPPAVDVDFFNTCLLYTSNEYTYPPYSEVQAKELLCELRRVAPFIVVDCSSYIANDILSALALMERCV